MYRFIKILLLAVLLISGSNIQPAAACTLWAANGSTVESGGSLLVKNRDWAPDHRQEMQIIVPEQGYKYVGLFALDGEYSGLKAGINEKGLVIVSASASSIPMRERKVAPSTPRLLHKLLANNTTVDEVIQKTGLFKGPRFLMVADKNKVASIEIGPGGAVSIVVKENSSIYHTNHYVTNEMQQYNKTIGTSSLIRYERIGGLLSSVKQPYDLDTFLAFSHDKNDGDDNSIFRVGSTERKPKTLAIWAAAVPQNKPPELFIEIYNPYEPGFKESYVLDNHFWDQQSILR